MGGKQGRNQKRSLAIVDEAHTKKQQLTQLTDAQLVTKARDLTSTGEITDAAEFLAILAIAAERTLKMTPFPVQSQAVLPIYCRKFHEDTNVICLIRFIIYLCIFIGYYDIQEKMIYQ